MQIKKFVFSMFFLMPLMQFAGISSFAADSYTKYDVNAMKQRVQDTKTQKKTVKVYAVCDDAAGKTGGKEYCIKDFFEPTNVQVMQAIALAKEYALVKNGHTIYCGGSYRKSWNDDYIKCSDGTNFYEFRFDDIYESFDNTILYSIKDAICRMYGGKLKDSSAAYCDIDQYNCSKINTSMQKFGYSAEYVNIMNGVTGCKMSFDSKSADSYELKTAFGIDNKKFINLQLKSGADLHFFLKRYVERSLSDQGVKLTSFSCNNSFNTYYTDSISNLKDDILTCKVNGQQVDFLFDDMNESINITSDGGQAGLQCLASDGGVYDGKNCHGLSKEQCNEMNSKVPGGTLWDTTLDTCILKAASDAETLDKVTGIASGIGVGVGLAAITIATAGSATTVILVVTSAGLTTTGAVIAQSAQKTKEEEIRAFLAKSTKCNSASCAESTLKEYLEEAVQYQNNMTDDNKIALEGEIARLMELIPGSSNFYTDLIEQAIADGDDLSNYENWSAAEKQAFYGKLVGFIGAVVGLRGVSGIFKSIPNQAKNVVAVIGGKIDAQKIISIYSTYKKQATVVKSVTNASSSTGKVVENLTAAPTNTSVSTKRPITQALIKDEEKDRIVTSRNNLI